MQVEKEMEKKKTEREVEVEIEKKKEQGGVGGEVRNTLGAEIVNLSHHQQAPITLTQTEEEEEEEVWDFDFEKKDSNYPYRPPRIHEVAFQAEIPAQLFTPDGFQLPPRPSSYDNGERNSNSKDTSKDKDNGKSGSAATTNTRRKGKRRGSVKDEKDDEVTAEEDVNQEKERNKNKNSPYFHSNSIHSHHSGERIIELRPGQISADDSLVFKADQFPRHEIDNFLIYNRNMIEQTSRNEDNRAVQWRKADGSIVPTAGDETLLHLLRRYEYNIPLAKLSILSDIGQKTEEVYLKSLKEDLKTSTKILEKNRETLTGGYQGSRDRINNRYRGLVHPSSSSNFCLPNGSVASDGMGGYKKRNTNLAEIKKTWEILYKEADEIVKQLKYFRHNHDDCATRRLKFVDLEQHIHKANTFSSDTIQTGGDWQKKHLVYESQKEIIHNAVVEGRLNIARVHDTLCMRSRINGRGTILQIMDLLSKLLQSPIETEEENRLADILLKGQEWESKAQRLTQNNFRTASIEKLKTLVRQADAIPIAFPLREDIDKRLQMCTDFGREIDEVFSYNLKGRGQGREGDASLFRSLSELEDLLKRTKTLGFDTEKSLKLKAIVEQGREWQQDAQNALDTTVDLKQLRHLISRASNLPINTETTCTNIQVKIDQAEEWVERIRKSLPKQSKTRGVKANERVDFSQAQALLAECENIGVDIKEQSDVWEMVDAAASYKERVREALDESKDEEDLDDLERLLCEADGIPVEMEEHKILASEIKTRKWGFKVARKLADPKVTIKAIETIIKQAQELRAELNLSEELKQEIRIPEEENAKSLLLKVKTWLLKYENCIKPTLHNSAKGSISIPPQDKDKEGRNKQGKGKRKEKEIVKEKERKKEAQIEEEQEDEKEEIEVEESNLEELLQDKPHYNLQKYHRLQNLWAIMKEAQEIPINLEEYLEKIEEVVVNMISWYGEWQGILHRCGIDINVDYIHRQQEKNMEILKKKKNNTEKKESFISEDASLNEDQNTKESKEKNESKDENESSTKANGGALSRDAQTEENGMLLTKERLENQEQGKQKEIIEGEEENRIEDEEENNSNDNDKDNRDGDGDQKLTIPEIQECCREAEKLKLIMIESDLMKDIILEAKAWETKMVDLGITRSSKRKGQQNNVRASPRQIEELKEEGEACKIDLSEEIEKIVERLDEVENFREESADFSAQLAIQVKDDFEFFELNLRKELEALEAIRMEKTKNKEDQKENKMEKEQEEAEKEKEIKIGVPILASATAPQVEQEKQEAGEELEGGEEEELPTKDNDNNHNSNEKDKISISSLSNRTHFKERREASERRIQQLKLFTEKASTLVLETAEEKMILDLQGAVAWTHSLLLDWDKFLFLDVEIGFFEEYDHYLAEGTKILETFAKGGGDALVDEKEKEEEGEKMGKEVEMEMEIDVVVGSKEEEEEEGEEEEEEERKKKEKKEEEMEVEEDQNEKFRQVYMSMYRTIKLWWKKVEPVKDILAISREWLAKTENYLNNRNMEKTGAIDLAHVDTLCCEGEALSFSLDEVELLRADFGAASRLEVIFQEILSTTENEKKKSIDELKTLCQEAEKLRISLLDVKEVKKNISAAGKWIKEYNKKEKERKKGGGGDGHEDVTSMNLLVKEANSLCVNLTEYTDHLDRFLRRICFCRGPFEENLLACEYCAEVYHPECVQENPQDYKPYSNIPYFCIRCHLQNGFKRAMNTILEVAIRIFERPVVEPEPFFIGCDQYGNPLYQQQQQPPLLSPPEQYIGDHQIQEQQQLEHQQQQMFQEQQQQQQQQQLQQQEQQEKEIPQSGSLLLHQPQQQEQQQKQQQEQGLESTKIKNEGAPCLASEITTEVKKEGEKREEGEEGEGNRDERKTNDDGQNQIANQDAAPGEQQVRQDEEEGRENSQTVTNSEQALLTTTATTTAGDTNANANSNSDVSPSYNNNSSNDYYNKNKNNNDCSDHNFAPAPPPVIPPAPQYEQPQQQRQQQQQEPQGQPTLKYLEMYPLTEYSNSLLKPKVWFKKLLFFVKEHLGSASDHPQLLQSLLTTLPLSPSSSSSDFLSSPTHGDGVASNLPAWSKDAGMTLALLLARNGISGIPELKKLMDLADKEVQLSIDLNIYYTRYLLDVMIWCAKCLWCLRKRSDITEVQLLLKERKTLSPDMYLNKALKKGLPVRNFGGMEETIYAPIASADLDDPAIYFDKIIKSAAAWGSKCREILADSMTKEENKGDDILGPVDAHLQVKKYIPVRIREEMFLILARQENMERYCYCRCFWDGTNMLECNSCRGWFHVRCVGITQEIFDTQYSGSGKKKGKQFYCVECSKKRPGKYPFKEYVAPSNSHVIQKALDELSFQVMEEDAEMLATMDGFKNLWPGQDLLIEQLKPAEWIDIKDINYDTSALKAPPIPKKEKSAKGKGKGGLEVETGGTKRKRKNETTATSGKKGSSTTKSTPTSLASDQLIDDNMHMPMNQVLGLGMDASTFGSGKKQKTTTNKLTKKEKEYQKQLQVQQLWQLEQQQQLQQQQQHQGQFYMEGNQQYDPYLQQQFFEQQQQMMLQQQQQQQQEQQMNPHSQMNTSMNGQMHFNSAQFGQQQQQQQPQQLDQMQQQQYDNTGEPTRNTGQSGGTEDGQGQGQMQMQMPMQMQMQMAMPPEFGYYQPNNLYYEQQQQMILQQQQPQTTNYDPNYPQQEPQEQQQQLHHPQQYQGMPMQMMNMQQQQMAPPYTNIPPNDSNNEQNG